MPIQYLKELQSIQHNKYYSLRRYQPYDIFNASESTFISLRYYSLNQQIQQSSIIRTQQWQFKDFPKNKLGETSYNKDRSVAEDLQVYQLKVPKINVQTNLERGVQVQIDELVKKMYSLKNDIPEEFSNICQVVKQSFYQQDYFHRATNALQLVADFSQTKLKELVSQDLIKDSYENLLESIHQQKEWGDEQFRMLLKSITNCRLLKKDSHNSIFNLERVFVDHQEGMVNFYNSELMDTINYHQEIKQKYPQFEQVIGETVVSRFDGLSIFQQMVALKFLTDNRNIQITQFQKLPDSIYQQFGQFGGEINNKPASLSFNTVQQIIQVLAKQPVPEEQNKLLSAFTKAITQYTIDNKFDMQPHVLKDLLFINKKYGAQISEDNLDQILDKIIISFDARHYQEAIQSTDCILALSERRSEKLQRWFSKYFRAESEQNQRMDFQENVKCLQIFEQLSLSDKGLLQSLAINISRILRDDHSVELTFQHVNDMIQAQDLLTKLNCNNTCLQDLILRNFTSKHVLTLDQQKQLQKVLQNVVRNPFQQSQAAIFAKWLFKDPLYSTLAPYNALVGAYLVQSQHNQQHLINQNIHQIVAKIKEGYVTDPKIQEFQDLYCIFMSAKNTPQKIHQALHDTLFVQLKLTQIQKGSFSELISLIKILKISKKSKIQDYIFTQISSKQLLQTLESDKTIGTLVSLLNDYVRLQLNNTAFLNYVNKIIQEKGPSIHFTGDISLLNSIAKIQNPAVSRLSESITQSLKTHKDFSEANLTMLTVILQKLATLNIRDDELIDKICKSIQQRATEFKEASAQDIIRTVSSLSQLQAYSQQECVELCLTTLKEKVKHQQYSVVKEMDGRQLLFLIKAAQEFHVTKQEILDMLIDLVHINKISDTLTVETIPSIIYALIDLGLSKSDSIWSLLEKVKGVYNNELKGDKPLSLYNTALILISASKLNQHWSLQQSQLDQLLYTFCKNDQEFKLQLQIKIELLEAISQLKFNRIIALAVVKKLCLAFQFCQQLSREQLFQIIENVQRIQYKGPELDVLKQKYEILRSQHSSPKSNYSSQDSQHGRFQHLQIANHQSDADIVDQIKELNCQLPTSQNFVQNQKKILEQLNYLSADKLFEVWNIITSEHKQLDSSLQQHILKVLRDNLQQLNGHQLAHIFNYLAQQSVRDPTILKGLLQHLSHMENLKILSLEEICNIFSSSNHLRYWSHQYVMAVDKELHSRSVQELDVLTGKQVVSILKSLAGTNQVDFSLNELVVNILLNSRNSNKIKSLEPPDVLSLFNSTYELQIQNKDLFQKASSLLQSDHFIQQTEASILAQIYSALGEQHIYDNTLVSKLTGQVHSKLCYPLINNEAYNKFSATDLVYLLKGCSLLGIADKQILEAVVEQLSSQQVLVNINKSLISSIMPACINIQEFHDTRPLINATTQFLSTNEAAKNFSIKELSNNFRACAYFQLKNDPITEQLNQELSKPGRLFYGEITPQDINNIVYACQFLEIQNPNLMQLMQEAFHGKNNVQRKSS